MADADYAQQVAETLIKQLREGTAAWIKPWQPGTDRQLPYNALTGVSYKGANSLYLHAIAQVQGYGDNRWMTYKQAQQMGAQVRRGERSTTIQFWQWSDRVPVTDEAGAPVRDTQGKPVYNEIQRDRPMPRSAAVFNAAQIDGLPPAEIRPVPPLEERHQRAENLLIASGAAIRELAGDRAFYSLSRDEITLPERAQFRDRDGTSRMDGFFATALHELGHWTGHPDRLDRDMAHPYGSEMYAREELRAEIASLMLGDELGIGHDPRQHVAYIDSWISTLEKDPREIFRAATAAIQINNYVLGFEKEHQPASEIAPAVDSTRPVSVAILQPDLLDNAEADVNKRRYLAVPYADKNEAREMGARWDKSAKAWWIGASVDPAPFKRWIEGASSVIAPTGTDPLSSFADAVRAAGLRLTGAPQMDGTLHRVPVEGDKGKMCSGAYVGYLDGRPGGMIQNFRTQTKINWKAEVSTPLDKEAVAHLAAEVERKRAEREKETIAIQVEAARKAVSQLEAARPANSQHPYLVGKGVAAHSIQQDANDRLMVPIADLKGTITSIQTIAADGTKSFLSGGKIAGGQHLIGDNDPARPLYIAEGYATGATIHELTGETVSVAFNVGNLRTIAEQARELWPDRPIIIAGDNDQGNTLRTFPDGRPLPNIGAIKAQEAAQAVNGIAVIPPDAASPRNVDWNDHMQTVGKDQAMRDFKDRQTIAMIELRVEREIERETEMAAFGLNPMDSTRDVVRDQIQAQAIETNTPAAEQAAERTERPAAKPDERRQVEEEAEI